MTLRESIINLCQQELGTKEYPAGSNKVKYNDWYYPAGHEYHRAPTPWHWCGTAVSYIYHWAAQHLNVSNPLYDLQKAAKKAGVPTAGMTELGYHYVPTFDNFARKVGWVTDQPQPGDIVNFDWNKDGLEDHTGIFHKWAAKQGYFYAFEGNTTADGQAGSQSNGGEFCYKLRHVALVSSFVSCC